MVQSLRSGRFAASLLCAAGILLVSASVSAQEATQQAAQPQQQAQQAPAMTLDSGAGILFHMIKPDRTADFEWLVGKIKEALLASEEPARKQQAAGIQIHKSVDPVPNSPNVMYVMVINPAVKDADYSMQGLIGLLYKAYPAEQQDIFKKVQGAFGGPSNRVNLQPVVDFSK